MFSSIAVVALALASQLGGPNDRYPGGITGQPSAATNNGSNGAPPPLAPLNNSTPPATNGVPRNSTSPQSSSPYAPTRPSNFNSQPATPPMTSNGAAPNIGQQPPSSYQSPQNSFLGNNS